MQASRARYLKLIEEILAHDRSYYLEARPRISDYEYDQLMQELQLLERQHPEWITAASPTQRVSDLPTKGFVQVAHSVPMLSLANTYSQEEVEEFVRRVYKLLERTDVSFCAELKMDGVAICARYEQGRFVRGLTRGDGKRGDDVTSNLKTIRSLPLQLVGSHLPDLLEVRGEVFLTHRVFAEQNTFKEEAGEAPWANPRNAAAGSLKLLDPKEVARRKLSVVCYGLSQEVPGSIRTQHECHEKLAQWGLPIFPKSFRELCRSVEEVLAFAERVHRMRADLPFDIDGIVVKVDELKWHDLLGSTGKSPRWAVAYKFAPEQAQARIQRIVVQVGRTGVLTPVAEIEPTLLAGSSIARVTLHNHDEIVRKDIREGDLVTIEKGGDVIPKIVTVQLAARPKDSHPWRMPEQCPSCHAPLVRCEGEVAVRCPNSHKCPEQAMRRILFFAGKDAMDIEHLGEKVVEKLCIKGLVKTPADLYSLTERELRQLEGFQARSIHNLLASIEASRTPSLERFLLALGIKYVGKQTAEVLAETVGDLDRLMQMSEEPLRQLEGIGEKSAHAIVEYFADPTHRREIQALRERGVHPQRRATPARLGHPFEGKTFVLTGTLQRHTREQASRLIKERGGRVANAVSRSTDYLLVGQDPGSKQKRAQQLQVQEMNEEEFERQL